LQEPEKFICISYPTVDFLIPNDYVHSAVGVKDLDTSLLQDYTSGIFDFDSIAAEFHQTSVKSSIKTMIVFKGSSINQLSIVTSQSCKVCTIQLKDFSLFSDYYSESFKKFGLLACNFTENRIRFLIDVKQIIKIMTTGTLEEL